MSKAWTPYDSLTQAPTNLKEAIDWVLRVTGKDGKKNEKPQQPSPSPPRFSCICFLAKAVKDLLYDARSPESPGPTSERNWDDILLKEEQSIVQPVLTDLGLLSGESGTVSTTFTNAGGTEVIGTLIDHLAQGLQKWVGWQEENKGTDVCCLNTDKGVGKKCDCPGGGGGAGQCCTGASGTCTCAAGTANNNCYKSAYSKKDALWTTIVNGTTGSGGSVDAVQAAQEVHLLARIFLGSVCLIWSGLSQLGFLTGGKDRWSQSKLHEIKDDGTSGLGSFMAAVGYDLDRLNGSGTGQQGKKGTEVAKMLTDAFSYLGNGTSAESVAEYYSSIYSAAQGAVKGKKTEEICTKYPLLVLHILASGYFRAGSAGAKGITSPAKPATSTSQSATTSDPKKDNTPRKPRTIREILYWLSALPYTQGYKDLVERMEEKMDQMNNKQDTLALEGITTNDSTTLKRNDITHYLLAACGYCPLVLIGIQGTIATSGTDSATQGSGGNSNGNNQGGSPNQNNGQSNKNKCPKHKDNRHTRCDPKDIKEEEDANKTTEAVAQPPPAAPAQQQSTTTGEPLKAGQVCYGGYHLAVKDFGPLHGMYANGLYGFDLDGSPAQCLDQLRVYVYHCFYQLYFLRMQCKVGVAGDKAVLGWKSCRYGSGVNVTGTKDWRCSADSKGQGAAGNCKCKEIAGHSSPLMAFLCDGPGALVCGVTVGKTPDRANDPYPEIMDHMDAKKDIGPKHFEAPQHCPVPMGWQSESTHHRSTTGTAQEQANHFKDLKDTHKTLPLSPPGQDKKYPVHCTGNTLSLLLEFYCDPDKCQSGTLVVLLRLLACITPTVPRTLGDLFGFYYYIVYIGGNSKGAGGQGVHDKLTKELKDVRLSMLGSGPDAVVSALAKCRGAKQQGHRLIQCSDDCKNGDLISLVRCMGNGSGNGKGKDCGRYLCPLSGQQYGQLSPLMAGTYLSWLVYLIGEFQEGLKGLEMAFRDISCASDGCTNGGQPNGCGTDCKQGTHGGKSVCCCESVVSCTGVLPVLYRYGFGYGDSAELGGKGTWSFGENKRRCHQFLCQLESVIKSTQFKELINEINQLIYTTRLPWIFVLTLAWLVAVLYLAFGAIWPLDWAHMRSHCRGWFRKGSLSPWEVLMVGKKKGRGILEFFGGK